MITVEEKKEEIFCCKSDANEAKNRLIEIFDRLYSVGAIREANSLGTIIEKLETWQNK